MSGDKIKGSLRNATDVIKSSNDPRRTYDPRNVWDDSRRITGNELGNWSPSVFGGMSERIQSQNASAAAANEAALSQRAQEIAAQMFGGAYQGGQVSGGGGSGMMATPMLVSPQQQPNQGIPMLQNLGSASRGDISSFLAQMRQGMPNTGYNPAIPRTVMPLIPQAPQSAQMPLAGQQSFDSQGFNDQMQNLLGQFQRMRTYTR